MLFLSCALCGLVDAQTPATEQANNVRVKQIKPTIYVSLERRDKEKAWFRLHNNTTWAIAVQTGTFYFNRNRTAPLSQGKQVFTLPNNVEIDSLHYYVEKEPMSLSQVKAPELRYPDSSSISWISSKESILFSVPINQLVPGLMIYVPFHYEWELNEQLIFNSEPDHRVYFRGVDLSEDTLYENAGAIRRRN